MPDKPLDDKIVDILVDWRMTTPGPFKKTARELADEILFLVSEHIVDRDGWIDDELVSAIDRARERMGVEDE